MRVIKIILSFTILITHYLDAQNTINKIESRLSCGSIMFDSGGASGSYENNSYSEVTFYPSSENEYVSIESVENSRQLALELVDELGELEFEKVLRSKDINLNK